MEQAIRQAAAINRFNGILILLEIKNLFGYPLEMPDWRWFPEIFMSLRSPLRG